jgi:hypothetical protein
MNPIIKYFSQNKIKKIVMISFLLILSINYIYGYRYSIPLIDNLVYKNTYYPLIFLWIGLVWCWHLSEKFLFKVGFILFFFSCFYQLIDKRIVAEILMSYCLLVFLTATIKLIKESISSE